MKKQKYSKEQAILALQVAYQELGRTPLSNDFYGKEPSRNTFSNLFGSWNLALKAANIPLVKRQSIPKQEIIEDVKRVADLLDKSPTITEYDELGKFAIPTIQKIGYSKILKQLGLKVHRNVPKEQVIQELKDVAQELGYTPSVEEFIAHPKGSNNWQVYKHFKEYKDLLNAAGLDQKVKTYKPPLKYSKNELLEKLKLVADGLGHSPTVIEWYEQTGVPAHTVASSYFGSYKNFLKEAGLKVFRYFNCKDGHIVTSFFERMVDNFLFENRIDHQIQVKVTPDRQWTCDFVVGTLWIEADGMKTRPYFAQKRLEEKIQFYKENSYNYIIITREQDWQNIILENILNG